MALGLHEAARRVHLLDGQADHHEVVRDGEEPLDEDQPSRQRAGVDHVDPGRVIGSQLMVLVGGGGNIGRVAADCRQRLEAFFLSFFFDDLPAIHKRRKYRATDEVLTEETRGKRPRYYLQNFHFQSGAIGVAVNAEASVRIPRVEADGSAEPTCSGGGQ